MTTLLVCGGRDFHNWRFVYAKLDEFRTLRPDIDRVVHGGATGADALAGLWAHNNGIEPKAYRAAWRPNGIFDKAAGPKRNRRMMQDARPDYAVAFPGGPGTKNMVAVARRAGVLAVVWTDKDVQEFGR